MHTTFTRLGSGVLALAACLLSPAAVADPGPRQFVPTPASLALLRALADVGPEAEAIDNAVDAARLRFEAVDLNGDGVRLTDLLYRTQLLDVARSYANIEQFFHTDLNRDGRSERGEVARFVAYFAEEFEAEADETPEALAERLADVAMLKYDRDGDDAVTPDEAFEVERDAYQAARVVAYAQVEQEFEIWLTFDADGDEAVTFEEMEPHLRAALQEEGAAGPRNGRKTGPTALIRSLQALPSS